MNEIERLKQDRGPYSRATQLAFSYATTTTTTHSGLYSNAYQWFANYGSEIRKAKLSGELHDLQRTLRAFELILLSLEIKLSG